MSVGRVLLVDDDRAVREALGQTLELAGLRPVLAGSYIEAKDHIAPDFEGVVLSDIRMPGKDGFALLEHSRKVDPDLPVILLTGEGDVPMAVRGMSGGAFDFLEKPCNPSDLLAVVGKALKTRALVLENRALKREIRRGDAAARMLVGTSALSEQMREAARAAARTSAEVLVSGPPGAGTAKVAEVIHLLSAAAMRPFVKLSAASATPDSLLQVFEQGRRRDHLRRRGRGPAARRAIRACSTSSTAIPAPASSPAPTATSRARRPRGASTPIFSTRST